jgi:hypothetical protein
VLKRNLSDHREGSWELYDWYVERTNLGEDSRVCTAGRSWEAHNTIKKASQMKSGWAFFRVLRGKNNGI